MERRDLESVIDLIATSRGEADGTIVELCGDIDVFTVAKLFRIVEGLLSSGEAVMTLDVSGVEYIDLRGAGALRECATLANAAGGRFTLRGPSQGVRRLIDLFDLSGLLVES